MIQALSIVGRMKTGKTTLGLSAPKPLIIFDFEQGVNRIEPKYLKDMDKVKVVSYAAEMMTLRKKEIENIKRVKKLVTTATVISAEVFWIKILQDYNAALEDANITSIMFDTFSSVWEARRLAFLEEVQKAEPDRKQLTPQEYFIPNVDMKMLITQAGLHNKILIVTHHTRSKYVAGVETAEEEPDGFKYTSDLIEVEVWMSKRMSQQPLRMTPYGTIKACRLCMAAEEAELEAPTYDILAAYIDARRGTLKT